jgi:hypothetical protein
MNERFLEIELDLPITDEMQAKHDVLVAAGIDSSLAWRRVAQDEIGTGDVQGAVQQLS